MLVAAFAPRKPGRAGPLPDACLVLPYSLPAESLDFRASPHAMRADRSPMAVAPPTHLASTLSCLDSDRPPASTHLLTANEKRETVLFPLFGNICFQGWNVRVLQGLTEGQNSIFWATPTASSGNRRASTGSTGDRGRGCHCMRLSDCGGHCHLPVDGMVSFTLATDRARASSPSVLDRRAQGPAMSSRHGVVLLEWPADRAQARRPGADRLPRPLAACGARATLV